MRCGNVLQSCEIFCCEIFNQLWNFYTAVKLLHSDLSM